MHRNLLRSAFALVIAAEIGGWFFAPGVASDFTWLGLVVTVGFAWAMMEVFRMPWFVWALAWLAIVLDAASALFELYSRIAPWDRWIHALGGSIIAAGALNLVLRGLHKGHVNARRRRPFIVGSVYLFVAGIGFLYEFWEYLIDHIQYGYPKSLVSAYNSIEDQLFNLLGATIVLGIFLLWEWRQRRT